MKYIFNNPFNADDIVYIVGDFTDGIPLQIYKYTNRSININISGIIKYYYIVNGNITYCKNKLYIIAENGKIYNYFITNSHNEYDPYIFIQSIYIYDIDAYYNKSIINSELSSNYYIFELCLNAINEGNTIAMNIMAYNYQTGNKEFYNKAMIYYKMAMEKNCMFAYVQLGDLYNSKNDIINAKKYYIMAMGKYNEANKNQKIACVNAMVKLGNICIEKTKKILYYKMAAKLGNSEAMYKLGLLFEKISYIKKSAEYFNIDAMIYLGDYYNNNNDIEKMIYYYELAIKNGSKIAISRLYNYYKNKNIFIAHKYNKMLRKDKF